MKQKPIVNPYTMCGRLTVVTGPMFSGKSTQLLRYKRKYSVLKKQVLCIKHASDFRYSIDSISTHDREEIQATSVTHLYDISFESLKTIDVVLIDEGHFYDDLFSWVSTVVDMMDIHVVVAGLFADYRRVPLQNMVRIMAHADKVLVLSAYCIDCADDGIEREAHFTSRLPGIDRERVVGGADIYQSRCRKHYLESKIKE